MTERRTQDYYATLGVSRDADQRTIKDAFRKLTLEFHPDRTSAPAATERFKEIAAAYAVLGDPKKRAAYDARGRPAEEYPAEDLFAGVDLEDWLRGTGFGSAWFERLFGGRWARRRSSDLDAVLTITLERVATGGDEHVRYARPTSCSSCSGSGYEHDTTPRTPEAKRRCRRCRGIGSTDVIESTVVNIPAGIEDGTVLRMPGQGVTARGHERGDLYVEVRIAAHPVFVRSACHLLARARIEVADAVLGTDLSVPSLHGPLRVRVPPGTQPETTLRIRGEGLPRLGAKERGDLLVTLTVHLPESVTAEVRRAFEALRDLR